VTSRIALSVVLCASLGSCRSLDFVEIAACKDWNLEQLHDENGGHRLRAATMGDTEYFLRFGIGGLFKNSRARVQEKDEKRQKKVPEKVLDNYLALSDFSPRDPRIAAMQAKWAVWLAVADPWPLVRERAVLELGELSKRLGLNALPGLPAAEDLSSREEVEVALAQLIRAAKSSVFEVRPPDETEVLDIQAACDLLRSLVLDVENGHSALEVVEVLIETGDKGAEFRDPMQALSRDLTRDLAGQALARAVRDPEPIVRAAAIQSIVEATGTAVLQPILEQMVREPSPLVLTRILQLVRVHGLPDVPKSVSPEAAARVEEVWIDVIYSFATAHPEGRVRVNAMQALQAVAGGPGSLRSEDWQSWWSFRHRKLEATGS
jgi:HEAT repeat protein